MKGIIFLGDKKLKVVDVPDPTPGPNEVIIKIMASGMCGSDLNVYRLPASDNILPVIRGHEPCGIVVEVGSNVSESQARIGDRKMIYHYVGCGNCENCNTGWEQMCLEQPVRTYGWTIDGGHAEYMKADVGSLLPLPEGVSFVAGAAIACGTGTAWSALQRLGLQGQHTIAIFGQGPVGIAGTQLAAAMGARVIAIDINEDRLANAKKLGAYVTINSAIEKDVVGAVRDLTNGRGVHLALDATASDITKQQSVQSIKQWGKVCYVGEHATLTLNITPDLNHKQATVMGSWTFNKNIQYECACFVGERGVDVDALFTNRYRLEQAEEAYIAFEKGSGGKGVFLPHGE